MNRFLLALLAFPFLTFSMENKEQPKESTSVLTEEAKLELIRDNKHVWFAMANNLECKKDQLPQVRDLELESTTNTAQSYRTRDEIRDLSLNYTGSSLAGCTETGKLFSLTGKEKNDEVNVTCTNGSIIYSVAQHETDGLIRFFTRKEIRDFDSKTRKDFRHHLQIDKAKVILTSPNYQWILAKFFRGNVQLIRLNSENTPPTNAFLFESPLLQKAVAFAMSGNGTRGLITDDSRCGILEINGSECNIKPLGSEYQNVVTVDISADGNTGLIVDKNSIRIIDMETLAFKKIKLPTINAAALSPCGKYVLTGHWDGYLKFSNIPCLDYINLCKTDETFTSVCFSGDGNTIAAGSDKGVYKISCSEIIKSLYKATPSCVSTMLKLFHDKKTLDDPALVKEFLDSLIVNKGQLLKRHELKPETLGRKNALFAMMQFVTQPLNVATQCAIVVI